MCAIGLNMIIEILYEVALYFILLLYALFLIIVIGNIGTPYYDSWFDAMLHSLGHIFMCAIVEYDNRNLLRSLFISYHFSMHSFSL